ncbi:MAG: carotenoid 1,2-hydratase [Woeseiaceae bacterium]
MNDTAFPAFTTPVPETGYRWWYVDGLSDCGRYGIVVIAFIGSVFSPYYFAARSRGRGNPHDHCSINVALYGPRHNRWAMTERDGRSLQRKPDCLRIGRSRLLWHDDGLVIEIDERSAPLPRKLRGTIRLQTRQLFDQPFTLDPGGRHTWQPIAPAARIEVDFEAPGIGWQGEGYLDSNAGQRPLEDDFRRWDWCRLGSAQGVHICYDVVGSDDRHRSLALLCRHDGRIIEQDTAPRRVLGHTGWRIHRETRCPGTARVAATLEDTPFYARSRLEVDDGPERHHAMHESLSLERFTRPWVRLMLPFRMPRITRPV